MPTKNLGTPKNLDSGATLIDDALVFDARQRIELTSLSKPRFLATHIQSFRFFMDIRITEKTL